MEQEVMQAIRAELESNIDAKYREFHSSLVTGQNCRILGVRIPVSRRIAKATSKRPIMKFIPNSLIRKSTRSF